MINYEKELNKEQLKVVYEGDGPCLVLSGPGSGKTRTLVHRTAYLLEKGVPAEKILLLTFTKKAARGMLDRVFSLLGEESKGVCGGTFHHAGNLFLREDAHLLGYSKNFTIIDEEDSRSMISSLLKGSDLRAPVVQNIISLSVNSKTDVESVLTERLTDYSLEIAEVFQKYTEKKKENSLMDYDDLLLNWLNLLSTKDLSSRFSYILVDEYQDTNALQDEIVKKMSKGHGNLLAVGDDAQSIFSFRAADVGNILRFSDNYPGAKVFYLETNYRSTGQILSFANEVIKNNELRLDKDLKSVKGEGVSPEVVPLDSSLKQAQFIVSKLRNIDVPLSDVAVLFRAHYHSAELEIELSKNNIPYLMRGGVRFFEQAHVKDLSAFLRILVNFRDDVSWKRLFLRMDGVGKTYASRVVEEILKRESIEKVYTEREDIAQLVSSRAREGVLPLISILEDARKEASITKLINIFISRFYEKYLHFSFDNARDRMEDINRFCQLSEKYERIEELVAEFSLSEDYKKEEKGDMITLSTVHQAKGLEWDTVFVISLQEGEFPYIKAVEEGAIEEERRLFYVAVTRCKRNLFLLYPMYNFRGLSAPSRFLREAQGVEEELIDDDDWLCM